MFLSRLRLHPRDLLAIRDLGDPGHLHRTLMRAFPEVDVPEPRRHFGVLHRVESDAGTVLVQSRVEPAWDDLPEGYVLGQETRDASPVLEAIATNRRFRFRLVGNPSRKSAAHRPGETPPRNSRRVALTTDDARHDWLAGRAAAAGFVLSGAGPHDGVRIDALPLAVGGQRKGRSGITVRPVLFEGVLEICDPELTRSAVLAGIGPAKAYGCGLLSLGSS